MTYLFLAVPNFCGSTLLSNLIETCPTVVTLRNKINKDNSNIEGNTSCNRGGYINLHGPHSIEANMEHVYSDPNNYDWPLIRMQWDEIWSRVNPYAEIRLQKTPADIFRVKQIIKYFDDLKWILSVRNPYNHVESIFRKSTFLMDPFRQFDQICYHAIRCLYIQMENERLLEDNCYTVTYEDFVSDTKYHRQAMGRFLPGLEYMNLDAELVIKGKVSNKLTNENNVRMNNFTRYAPTVINEINKYFKEHEGIINHWGYELM